MTKKIKVLLVKLVYIIVLVLTFISLIREFNNSDIKNIILCVISIFLYFIPCGINKFIKIIFPTIIRIAFVLFMFSTIVLGEVNDFYEFIPFWDDTLHIVQGFIVASIGFSLIYMFFKDNDDGNNKNKDVTNNGKILIILFSLCLSLSVGIIWEIGEYITDCNMKVDMQKDKYLYNFNSILLNPKKDNEVMVVDKIGYTSIYDETGKKIVTFNGYLDIGLHDTMDDLIDTLVGSLLFVIIGWLYLSNKKKYKFVEIILLKN